MPGQQVPDWRRGYEVERRPRIPVRLPHVRPSRTEQNNPQAFRFSRAGTVTKRKSQGRGPPRLPAELRLILHLQEQLLHLVIQLRLARQLLLEERLSRELSQPIFLSLSM